MRKIKISSAAKKDLKKLDKEVAVKILKEIFTVIEQNPLSGNELSGDLKGLRSFHFIYNKVHYRIIYELLNDFIGIIMVATRGKIYKRIKKRI